IVCADPDFLSNWSPQPHTQVGFSDQDTAISTAARRAAQARFIDSDLPSDFISLSIPPENHTKPIGRNSLLEKHLRNSSLAPRMLSKLGTTGQSSKGNLTPRV